MIGVVRPLPCGSALAIASAYSLVMSSARLGIEFPPGTMTPGRSCALNLGMEGGVLDMGRGMPTKLVLMGTRLAQPFLMCILVGSMLTCVPSLDVSVSVLGHDRGLVFLVVWGLVMVKNCVALGAGLRLVCLRLGLPWTPSLVYLVALCSMVIRSTFLVKQWLRDVVRLDMIGGGL